MSKMAAKPQNPYVGPDKYGTSLHEEELVIWQRRLWTLKADRIVNFTDDSQRLLKVIGTINLERA